MTLSISSVPLRQYMGHIPQDPYHFWTSMALASSEKRKKSWSDGYEHFNKIINRPPEINDEAISYMPQVDVNKTLADMSSEQEVIKSIYLLS